MSGGRGKGGHGNRSRKRTVSWGIINKIKISAFFLLHKTCTWMGLQRLLKTFIWQS